MRPPADAEAVRAEVSHSLSDVDGSEPGLRVSSSVRNRTHLSGYVSMQIIHRSSRRPTHTTPKVLTVTEAANLLRIGRSTAYEAANRYLAGDPDGLPVIRIGRCLRVPVKLIAELIEDADAFVETNRTELQPIDDPAATFSEFFDDEPLRLPWFD